MDKQELEVASQLLAAELHKQLKEASLHVAREVMNKFNNGPKPRPDEKAQIKLLLEIEGRSMYEVEDRVRMAKEGYVKRPTNNRLRQ